MQSDNLAHDADEDSVTRSLEAYLLWLFGYIMFNNSHGAYVDRVLVPYAQEIAEAAVEEMPNTVGVQRYLQPRTVASARHRCKISTMQFLQDVRFCYSFGRPIIDHSPYEPNMYGDTEDDRPTMGICTT